MKLQNLGQLFKSGIENLYPASPAGNESRFISPPEEEEPSRHSTAEKPFLTISRLRCDQGLPVCGSCVRRGDTMSCSYQSRRVGLQRHWPPSHTAPSSVQNRMDRLEQLVLTMMNQVVGDPGPNQAAPPPNVQVLQQEVLPGAQPALNTRSRMIRIDADYGNPYSVGEAHWAVLLNEASSSENLPFLIPVYSLRVDLRGTRLPSIATETI
jgi:hypothetical protein